MEKKYKCNHCGREFHARISHKCNGTFRKKRLNWTELTPKIKESETMKNKEKQEAPEFSIGDYIATRDGKVGIITNNGLWCFNLEKYHCPFDRYATDIQIKAMNENLKENGKYFNKETCTIEDIAPKLKVGDKVKVKNNHNIIPDHKTCTIIELSDNFLTLSYDDGSSLRFAYESSDSFNEFIYKDVELIEEEKNDDTSPSIEIDVNIPDGEEPTIDEIYELFDAIDEAVKEVKQSIAQEFIRSEIVDVLFEDESTESIMEVELLTEDTAIELITQLEMLNKNLQNGIKVYV